MMALSDMPLVSLLRGRLEWSQARQKVLAENVANADTPRFKPKDLVAPGQSGSTSVRVAQTNPLHLASSGDPFDPSSKKAGRFETRPSGNAVNIEDEMLKVAENQSEYQFVASLYQKSLSLLKTAAGSRTS